MKLITKGNPFPGFVKAVIMAPALLMASSLYAEVSKQDAELQNVRAGMSSIL